MEPEEATDPLADICPLCGAEVTDSDDWGVWEDSIAHLACIDKQYTLDDTRDPIIRPFKLPTWERDWIDAHSEPLYWPLRWK